MLLRMIEGGGTLVADQAGAIEPGVDADRDLAVHQVVGDAIDGVHFHWNSGYDKIVLQIRRGRGKRQMTQQDRESSQSLDSAEVGSDAATQARGNTNDLIDYLLSQLDPHPSVEPTPLRYMPVASRAWPFVVRHAPPSKLDPPDPIPYYCDRCKP
jgi:hypothetical protein